MTPSERAWLVVRDGRGEVHLALEPGERHVARGAAFGQGTARRDAAFELRRAFAQARHGFVHRSVIAGLRAGVERVERLRHQRGAGVHALGGLLLDLLALLGRKLRQGHERGIQLLGRGLPHPLHHLAHAFHHAAAGRFLTGRRWRNSGHRAGRPRRA